MKKYTIIKPDGYEKKPLKGLTQWCEALRSGKYEQGENSLCYNGKYCCLGVKCEIDERPKVESFSKIFFDENPAGISPINPAYTQLKDLGYFPTECRVVVDGFQSLPSKSLALCNDTGLTFPQIADIIEAFWYHVD